MACSSCGTKSGGGCAPAGCKSNGTCGTTGCNAVNVYDWFSGIDMPDDYETFNVVEIRYKGSRKEFFANTHKLDLFNGDYVLLESNFGYDIGTVSATGEIVRLQLKKKKLDLQNLELKSILRKANETEINKWEEFKAKEDATLEKARTIAFSLKLQMKISDIEYQGDGKKVTFFYTAEQRVDFRELIKRYADEFKVKIEMRHISYREEASRLGGVGVCGRPLCCSTWLTDYKQVNTGAARIQNLSINMEKLAGQCGKLKCCLNYELDLYLEAADAFPKAKVVKLETETGLAIGRKTDILKKLMWFSYAESPVWVPLDVDKVKELIELNKQGQKAPDLTTLAPETKMIASGSATNNDSGAEMLNNTELLEEDKEFEEEMRRQRAEINNKKQSNNKNQRNNKGNFNPQQKQQNQQKQQKSTVSSSSQKRPEQKPTAPQNGKSSESKTQSNIKPWEKADPFADYKTNPKNNSNTGNKGNDRKPMQKRPPQGPFKKS